MPLTITDIKKQTTFSNSTIHHWVKILFEKGYIEPMESLSVNDGKSLFVYVKCESPQLNDEMTQRFE